MFAVWQHECPLCSTEAIAERCPHCSEPTITAEDVDQLARTVVDLDTEVREAA